MSIHHHSSLVTCVASTNYLFTGSMDTSIVSWSNFLSDSSKAKPVNLYIGHTVAIRQISVSGNYQILVSLSNNGLVLVHDIRSAECLRKLVDENLESPCRAIAISEAGLIVCHELLSGMKVFSINGNVIQDKRNRKDDVKYLWFNKTGEFLLTGSDEGVGFYDIFEDQAGAYTNLTESFVSIVYPQSQEFLIYATTSDQISTLFSLEPLYRDQKKGLRKDITSLF